MLRTQISLTPEGRRALDAEAARTGRSISALILDAVEATYGAERCSGDDPAAMGGAFGSWKDRELEGAAWAEPAALWRPGHRCPGIRAGSRLLTRNVRHFPMFSDLRPPY